jgi:hypothetical protein
MNEFLVIGKIFGKGGKLPQPEADRGEKNWCSSTLCKNKQSVAAANTVAWIRSYDF